MTRIFRGNVLWLSVVSLFTDLSSEMIYPLLPFFLTAVLGAGPTFVGLVEGIAESTASLLKLASGWLSDRMGRRKPLVLFGYGLASIARPLMAIAQVPWHVLTIRFADRVGKGVRGAPRDALIADSVSAEQRGRAYGYHRAADHAGAVLGPVAATLVLLAAPGDYRLVFALAAVPAVLSVIVLALRVTDVQAPGPAAGKAKPEFHGFRGLGNRFIAFLVIVLVFTLGASTDAFLLLRAGELGVAIAAIPILWAVFHVSKMSWSIVGGRIADAVGPKRAIVAGWIVYALTYVGFAFASTELHAWALFLVYGLFHGLTEGPEKALVAAVAPAERRGAAFGAYHFVIGAAALPASLLFGVVWQQVSAAAAFGLGAVLALAAAVALALLRIGDR